MNEIPANPWIVPSAPAPPGYESNLINPDSNGDIGTVTLSIFVVLATIFVGLRLYVRFVATPAHGWDDCEYMHIQGPKP